MRMYKLPEGVIEKYCYHACSCGCGYCIIPWMGECEDPECSGIPEGEIKDDTL